MTEDLEQEEARLHPERQPPPQFPAHQPLRQLLGWLGEVDDWLDTQGAYINPLLEEHLPGQPVRFLATSIHSAGRQAELTWSVRIDRIVLLLPVEAHLQQQWAYFRLIEKLLDQDQVTVPLLMLRLQLLGRCVLLFESFLSDDDDAPQALAMAMANQAIVL